MYIYFWWGMTISEARLYDFRHVTPHPNAAYYSIFRVRQTVENKATDVGDCRRPCEQSLFLVEIPKPIGYTSMHSKFAYFFPFLRGGKKE